VIGECVNLAARIQDLTKRYQTFLLASDASIDALADRSREADVQGRRGAGG
jgi:class 3 adenylate cyclase